MGILDDKHRVFVNYETYYMSSKAAMGEFRKSRWRFTGMVTDPVSKVRFQPDGDSASAAAAGRFFYFSSRENAEKFAAAPGEYSTPIVQYAGRM